MMKKLDGKVALVTGSARGIGAAIAERLAEDGAAVAVNYSKSEKEARAVAARITERGGRAVVIQADVAAPGAVKVLVEETVRALGRLDILVNNAAAISLEPLGAIDEAKMRVQLATNVEAPIAAIRAAAPHLPPGGRVINISSLVQLLPIAGTTVYAASKGALDAMTRVWATELGPRGVTVNAVGPGPVDTDALRGALPEEARAQFVTRTPLGRIGRPDDIADVVAFLASPDARWVTGHLLMATGGFTP
jgi:3-oxoacyl-[acyl-carrier protein] reductase